MARRRAPVPVLWTVSAAALAYAAIGYPDNLVMSLVLATYTAASLEPRDRVLTLVTPVSLVAGIAMQLAAQTGFNWLEVVGGVTFSVAIPSLSAARSSTVGDVLRARIGNDGPRRRRAGTRPHRP